MWYIFLLRFILATTYPMAKVSFTVVKPLFFIGTRMSLSGLMLLGWCFLFKQTSCFIQRKDIGRFVQLALCQIYLPFSIDFYAAQYVPSNRWALINAACPFVTALFSWLIFKEALNVRKWMGLGVGIIGLATIFMVNQSSGLTNTTQYTLLPELVLTLTMIIYAYSWIIVKKLIYRYSLLLINGIIMTTGGLLSLATSVIGESWHVSPVYALQPYFILLFLNILVTITAFPLYAHLLKRYSVTLLAFSSLLQPLFVAIFGWFMFAGVISWHFMSALCLLSLGLYIFYKEEIQIESLSIKES